MKKKISTPFRSVFLTFFIAIFSVYAIFCLAFSLIYTNRSVQFDRNSKVALSQHYLDLVVSDTDHAFEDIYHSAVSLSHQDAMINLNFLTELTSTEKSSVFSVLSDAVSDNSMIEAAFVYLPEFSTILHSSFRTYNRSEFPWKSALDEYYREQEHIALTIDSTPTSCFLFYQGDHLYLAYEYLFSGENKSTLFFRLNLWNLLTRVIDWKEDESDVWVYREDGAAVFSSITKYPDYISADTIERLSGRVHIYEDYRFLLMKSSPVNHWKYIFVQPDPSRIPFHDALPLLLFTVCTTLVLAALSSWIISKKLYAPLQRLFVEVRDNIDSPGTESAKNEIEYINKAFSSVSERSRGLDEMLQDVAPDITSRLLSEMLAGKAVNYDYVLQNIGRLSGKFYIQDLYAVGIISLLDFPAREDSSITSDSIFADLGKTIGSLCMQKNMNYHILKYDNSRIVIIFSKSETVTKLAFNRQLKEVRHTILESAESRNIPIVMSTGEVYDSILNIRFSYKDALAIIEDKMQLQTSSDHNGTPAPEDTVLEVSEITESARSVALDESKAQDSKSYSKELQHILSCIDENDFHHAAALVRDLISKMETKQAAAADYQQLLQDTYEQISEMEYINTIPFEDGLFMMDADSAEKVSAAANRKLNKIIEILISQKKKTQNHYITAAQKQVQRKFSDGTLSLSSVAEAIGTNPSYLSKLFKQNLGLNFTDYLNQYRVKQSLEMLNATSDSIQNIAELCGFNSPQSYNRVFKKYYQITPTQYREKNANGKK